MIRKFLKLFPYILLLCIGVALIFPLFHTGFILTDDGSWMIIRLSAFYQSFREGQFPVRFLGRLNHSYGYPVANFLYPGFLYIGSLIHIAGFSFVNSIKILFGASVISSGIWIYLWLKKFFRTIPSTFGAVSFMAAPYFLFDLYSRGSVGELLALSLVAVGLYSIEAGLPWLFSLSVGFLVLAHNSIAFLFIIMFLAYLLVRRVMSRFMGWLLLGIGMASFFWMPAIYEQKYIVFGRAIISNPADYFIQYKTLWLVGLSGIAAALLTILARPKIRMVPFFVSVLTISLFMSSSLSAFLWNSRVMSSLLQFPFRMLSVSLFAVAWLTACSLEVFRKYWIPVGIIFVAIWVIHLRVVFTGIRYEYQPEEYYTTNEATTTVKDEYMPKWVLKAPLNRAPDRVELLKGSGTIDVNKLTTQYFDMAVHANEQSILQINTMYYPGWGVSVDNQLTPIDYKNDAGLIRVVIPAGEHRVIANFRETISRFIADICSFVAIVLFLAAVVTRRILLKKKQSPK